MNTLKIEFDPNANEFPEPLTEEFEGSIDAISCLHYAGKRYFRSKKIWYCFPELNLGGNSGANRLIRPNRKGS